MAQNLPIQGQRRDVDLHEMQPGDYGRSRDGKRWYCRPPWKHAGGDLTKHEVEEHPDRTISVRPSIDINIPGVGRWHGYLENGTWRELKE